MDRFTALTEPWRRINRKSCDSPSLKHPAGGLELWLCSPEIVQRSLYHHPNHHLPPILSHPLLPPLSSSDRASSSFRGGCISFSFSFFFREIAKVTVGSAVTRLPIRFFALCSWQGGGEGRHPVTMNKQIRLVDEVVGSRRRAGSFACR